MKQNIRDEVAAVLNHHAARLMQYFQKRLREFVDNKGRHVTHYIQEVNIVIKMLWDKDNFNNKFT